MLIHLLNLDRSKDRLAKFASANRHLTAVSRVPAVDGENLDVRALMQQGLITEGLIANDFYTTGAVGAALSHISLWQMAIETESILTVAEDDAILHPTFESQAPNVIKMLPPDWDFILWGWNFDLFLSFELIPGVSYCLAQFDQDRLRANVDKFQNQSIEPRTFKLIWAFGISCYSVTPKGTRALLNKCLPLKPTVAAFAPAGRVLPGSGHFRNVGIDSAMNNAWAELNAYICFPPLAITKNEREADGPHLVQA